ncbi:MAG: 2-C-methyl-D-erythritol 4-phosphate cytidylyltransferase [Candidatus Eremiobacteraeota bacterium]|nr:2-C-methyl-D-erythritol 4-phosphate cytidylyltransferase [Candidatus Eremiobacteraeota bacterium]
MGVTALIPAAGKGSRMRLGRNKLLLPLCGKPVLIHTLEVFEKSAEIVSLVVACHRDEKEPLSELCSRWGLAKVKHIVEGGEERQDSVLAMLRALGGETEFVAIHDGARPLLSEEDLLATIEAAHDADGAVLGSPLRDTIKHVGRNGVIIGTPHREEYWSAFTPQVFRLEKIMEAYEKAARESLRTTDDASIVEHFGGKVVMVQARHENLKLTTAGDLALCEAVLKERAGNVFKGSLGKESRISNGQ